MESNRSRRYLAACSLFSTTLFIFVPASPTFARHGTPPTSYIQTLPTSHVALKELPAVDVQSRLAEDAKSTLPGPLRFALPVTVDITPETDGTWEQLAEGTQLWRLRFPAPGATDLNFGFTRFWLPAGAELYIRSESEDYYEGPYTEQNNKPHGQLWIPVVPGDRAVVDMNWEDGITEPGSSGSGIWDSTTQKLVGFLSGGSSFCTNPAGFDCYGKFSVAWDGASSTSRLRDWRDPNGLGNGDG